MDGLGLYKVIQPTGIRLAGDETKVSSYSASVHGDVSNYNNIVI